MTLDRVTWGDYGASMTNEQRRQDLAMYELLKLNPAAEELCAYCDDEATAVDNMYSASLCQMHYSEALADDATNRALDIRREDRAER